jgi:hypothetical protein
MKYVAAVARFWWTFVVGDDWRVAVGVAGVLAVTWLIEDEGGNAWWLLPPAVAVVLAASLWRATRSA